jgi:hypothetical protein
VFAGCGALIVVGVVMVGLIASGAWPAALGLFGLLVWLGKRGAAAKAAKAQPGVGYEPALRSAANGEYCSDSGRQHADRPAQTWRQFLRETYRLKTPKNSGHNVKLGNRRGFDLGSLASRSDNRSCYGSWIRRPRMSGTTAAIACSSTRT